MAEKITRYENLIKIVHSLYCDDCEVEMQDTHICYTIDPPLYEYRCPKCFKTKTSHNIYPYTEYNGQKTDEYILKPEEISYEL